MPGGKTGGGGSRVPATAATVHLHCSRGKGLVTIGLNFQLQPAKPIMAELVDDGCFDLSEGEVESNMASALLYVLLLRFV